MLKSFIEWHFCAISLYFQHALLTACLSWQQTFLSIQNFKKGLIEKDIYAGIQIRKNGGEPLSALLILSEMAVLQLTTATILNMISSPLSVGYIWHGYNPIKTLFTNPLLDPSVLANYRLISLLLFWKWSLIRVVVSYMIICKVML